MNEFFQWNLLHHRPQDVQPRLTDAEIDGLFELMNDASLREDAMTIEMADGYMTACIVGPHPVPVHYWLETIFAQPTLPLPHDTERQQRLLHLLLRRHADIEASLSLRNTETTVDTIFKPLSAQVPATDCITPYRKDENGERTGRWEMGEWAEGFRIAMAEDDEWEPMMLSPDLAELITPVVLYSTGYNPDQPDYQINGDEQLFAWLIGSMYAIRTWWREYNRQPSPAALPFFRETQKVGRNDPCPCGSGKKYKKCCGTH